MRSRTVLATVAVGALSMFVWSCGNGDGGGSGDGVASGPLVLTGAQLEDVVLSADAVAEVMGAADVEVDRGSLALMLIGEVGSGTEVEARDYWSLDGGGRTLGVGPVDFASVVMLLVAEESDVVPLFDQITNAEPEYTTWEPITVRGAAVAAQAVGIPYEGEPEDEPSFEAILARRDSLVVMVSVSGSDTDAMVAATTALAELVFERAGEVSDAGDVGREDTGTGDPVADAFAEQLAINGELALPDDNRVECFAGGVIGQLSENRLAALGFTSDNIPSIYQAAWSDTEIDLLVNALETCVGGDPESITVIVAGPTMARFQPDLADCYVAEVTAAAGKDFYLDLFRFGLRFSSTPPSAEDEQAITQVIEPALAVCQPDAPTPLPGLGGEDDHESGPVLDEEWRIILDGDRDGVHIISMVKTFSPAEETDVEDVGGRLLWPETEIEICSADIASFGDGFVQISAFFPTADECGPAMGQAFDDYGLPETACLFVRGDGLDDEYCAPLATN